MSVKFFLKDFLALVAFIGKLLDRKWGRELKRGEAHAAKAPEPGQEIWDGCIEELKPLYIAQPINRHCMSVNSMKIDHRIALHNCN